MRAAQMRPHRITHLILSQTPTLQDMHAWVVRIVPWPLKVPVLGQLVAWFVRKKVALQWYRVISNLSQYAGPMPVRRIPLFLHRQQMAESSFTTNVVIFSKKLTLELIFSQN